MDEENSPQVETKGEAEEVAKKYLEYRILNPNNTLFLPEGSVRAIIAIVFTAICGIMLIKGMLVPEWFIALAASVYGYYFGGKK